MESNLDMSYSRLNSEIVVINHTWVIKQFSHLHQQGIGDFISSPAFTPKEDTNMEWKLGIYPKGLTQEKQEYVAIHLYSLSIGLMVKYQISLLDCSKKVLASSLFLTRHFDRNVPRCFTDLMKLKDLNNLVNDELHIKCEIKYVSNRSSVSGFLTHVTTGGLTDNSGGLLVRKAHSDFVVDVQG